MLKEYIIIPMDRLGVIGVQTSPLEAVAFVNKALEKGIQVNWLTTPTRIFSEEFPEAHVYSSGGFLLDNTSELVEELNDKQLIFHLAKSNIKPGHQLRNSKIGIYSGKGAAPFCIDPLVEVLDWSGFDYQCLSDKDIRKSLLDSFDIFLVPGGPDAGESYYWGLGETGYQNIKRFVAGKGQYFGICAGAYLPLTSLRDDNPYWLGLVDATDVQELDYWRTGTGFTRIRLTENDHPVFGGLTAGNVNTIDMVYWEGPGMKILSDKAKMLAKFDDFIASGTSKDYPRWDLLDNIPAKDSVDSWYNVLTKERFENHLANNSAMLETKVNGNRIILYSPHAEFGNIGITSRKNSQGFQLITNGLFYLGMD